MYTTVLASLPLVMIRPQQRHKDYSRSNVDMHTNEGSGDAIYKATWLFFRKHSVAGFMKAAILEMLTWLVIGQTSVVLSKCFDLFRLINFLDIVNFLETDTLTSFVFNLSKFVKCLKSPKSI